VKSSDVFLDEGYRTRDEKGIDGRYLIIERLFHAFRSVEDEDGWRVINPNHNKALQSAKLTQTECRNVI